MYLQESGEMYLETIYILSKDNPNLRSVDISEHMQYSKPSVSRAVGLLKEGGYIEVEPNGHIHLTELGAELAQKIFERHQILTRFFVSIGVDEQTASSDACRIEHVISDVCFEAIKNTLK
ncbi:metal-dependent transcriptional regulator [Eubacteriales bacterium OttesenSCG-928-G02]|nr:metal-dependent transcriptional regulator [Eubacteriales bacterium OttesenSCG-928-G02]